MELELYLLQSYPHLPCAYGGSCPASSRNAILQIIYAGFFIPFDTGDLPKNKIVYGISVSNAINNIVKNSDGENNRYLHLHIFIQNGQVYPDLSLLSVDQLI